MQLGNSASRWGSVSKFLHWTIALCILGAIITIVIRSYLDFEDLEQRATMATLMDTHRSLGLTALVLGLFRIVWIMIQKRPEMPATLNEFDRGAATWVHRSIYGLVILMPVTGWIASALFGVEFQWFYLFDVVKIADKNVAAVAPFYYAHVVLFYVLFTVLVVHISAAIWHHFSQRDNTLKRMLPGGGE